MAQNFLKHPTNAGLYFLPAARRARFAEMAEQAGLRLFDVNIGADRNIEKVLARLGRELKFPEWYGNNFDALHDCLNDPDWQKTQGVVILIRGLDHVETHAPQATSTLIEVLTSAIGERRSAKHPLWILLDTPIPGIAPLPEA